MDYKKKQTGTRGTEMKNNDPGFTTKVYRYTEHPWRALLVILGIQGAVYGILMFILFSLLHFPMNLQNTAALPTIILFSAGGAAYFFAPFFLGVPNGRCTFKEYLADIRLTHVRPFLRLLILTLSCIFILILCQGSGSIVYRISEGKPVTPDFAGKVFDLSQVLPHKSILLFTMFFSMFEEVAFRGVLLTMLLRKHSVWRAIVYSAVSFGAMHLLSVFAGRAVILTLGQVVWAFLFGLFYGYLFVRTGSLLPAMIIHWLSNVFQEPLTAYWSTAPPAINALYGIVFGYGLAAFLMILWVRFFSARWLPNSYNRMIRE